MRSVGQLAGVLDQRHAAVLVADDQVEVAVAVPVERDRHDHLQVHRQRARRRRVVSRSAGGVLRRRARADVLEVRKAVEELAAEQVEVAVAVEVGEVRRRAAERVDRLAVGLDSERLARSPAAPSCPVAKHVDEAVQRAVLPHRRAASKASSQP